ncbi:Vegetative incompatibility protein HET-E-1 [Cyphellophora attinorum]|uniref:Vegetative incompatibility protein HET-E-1 n=1 Tax=Cyphellophora attinorum TaxID=1664694 RepID=A0A0N1H013_9EURO|nr:Vegetative incompatibility protein HET-E-1 [Phialophora attinorum]KPI37022.1 Vegetative incompatibility protein HET-E-1 [Phialophora attinorum]
MRLLNTTNRRLEPDHFAGKRIPPYAILSHTWRDREVTYADITAPNPEELTAWDKVVWTCRLAEAAGIEYAWIDSCCIDRSSSTELSEAINSMYKWYERAVVCYAWLSDLVETGDLADTLSTCRWWKRGWCLQELLAPEKVLFYDKAWNLRGSKYELRATISRITSIDAKVLTRQLPLKRVPIGARMSWASGRETTRIEDIAYCLLGIFNVNLALVYGEEEKAFKRLQLEIVASSSDASIFYWKLPRSDHGFGHALTKSVYCGVLAPSPAAFSCARSLTARDLYRAQEYTVTNMGIKANDLVVTQYSTDLSSMRYVLPLSYEGFRLRRMTAVRLRKCGRDTFVREDPETLLDETENFQATEAEKYLLTEVPAEQTPFGMLPDSAFAIAHTRQSVLQIEHSPWVNLSRAFPGSTFDFQDKVFFTPVELSANHDDYDRALLRLVIRPYHETKGDRAAETFECCLVALGWSGFEEEDLTLSLVSRKSSHRQSVDMIESRAAMWDITTADILRLIKENRIPFAQEIRFHDTESNRMVVIRVRAVRTTDVAVCPYPFWKVGITCEEEQVPREQKRPQRMVSAAYKWLQGRHDPDLAEGNSKVKVSHHSYKASGWGDGGGGSGWRGHSPEPPPRPGHGPPDML